MIFTPSIKGQITRALQASAPVYEGPHTLELPRERRQRVTGVVRTFLSRKMPREQAKHAARKYVATLAI